IGQRQLEDEGRALSRRAVDVDAAAHRRGQLLRDRKPQPTAAVACAGARAFGLFEAAEQSLLLLLVESRTGIADGQPHPRRLQRRRLQANAAALGELDRVAEQVEQYLAHAAGIAQDPAWHVGGEVFMELQSALVRLRRAELDRFA